MMKTRSFAGDRSMSLRPFLSFLHHRCGLCKCISHGACPSVAQHQYVRENQRHNKRRHSLTLFGLLC